MFALFTSGNPTLIAIAFLVGNPLLQAFSYGPMGAFISELFETQLRYTGVSVTYQLGSVLGSGTAPLIATELLTPANGTTGLAIVMTVLFLLSAVAIWFGRGHARPLATSEHAQRFEQAHLLEA